MKNVFLFLIAVLLFASCTEKNQVVEPNDIWNGYGKYLKTDGSLLLVGGQDLDNPVGDVSYGLECVNDVGYFYVKYSLNEGYTMTESHVYAGLKDTMPMTQVKKRLPNETTNPKVGRFPFEATYNAETGLYECYIDCDELPPVDPGFVFACHGVVTGQGYHETAWAWGDHPFSDKSWARYHSYAYENPSNNFTVLYGTAYANDTLKLYHLDLTNGTTVLILKELIGDNSGIFDGTAYDDESKMFFFSNYSTGELYVNNLSDEDSESEIAGNLMGIAASGTFYDGSYFYIDANQNTINKVDFTSDWLINTETILDSIPDAITVNDIAMKPQGDTLFILGELDGGGRGLLSWAVADETFHSLTISLNTGGQIAYGSDGVLYAIAPITDGGSHSLTYIVDTSTGILVLIEDDIIIIEDPFSDISMGPIM